MCGAAVLPGAVVWLVPYSSHCSAGEYCCHVVYCYLPGVWCVGGECVSVLFVWWGILCPLPPRSGGGWGRRGWWGGIADGGWHGEERAAVLLTPRLVCWRPPSVCMVVPLNGGSGGLRVVPVFGLGPPLLIVLVPLVLSCPSCIASPLLSPSPPFVFAVTVLLV